MGTLPFKFSEKALPSLRSVPKWKGVLYVFPQHAPPDEKKTNGAPSVDESAMKRNSR
jgi:hypothetical protein